MDATARSFNEVIRQGTALFGAYLGFQGLKNTFSAIFNANNSFEQLSGSLKTVTGSVKGAQEAFALIEKFAIDTPYQLNEIVEAFKLLFFKVFHCFGKYLNKLLNYKSIIKLLGLISRKIYQLFSTSVNFA